MDQLPPYVVEPPQPPLMPPQNFQSLPSTEVVGPAFTKPSKFAFLWWLNYFSSEPTSLFNETGLSYDRQTGTLREPSSRNPPIVYWDRTSNTDCCFCCYRDPFWTGYYFASLNHHHSHSNNNNCNCFDNKDDGGAILMALIIVLAFIALIIAVMIVFYYPPSMIISWVLLATGTFVEIGVGRAPECQLVRAYNLTSAVICVVYFVLVCVSIWKMQYCYAGYFPGTPGIKIHIEELIKFYKINTYGFWCSIIVSLGLCIWGLTTVTDNTFDQCYFTTLTKFAWIVIQFLNSIAALGMANRMKHKHDILSNPPEYQA